jgi:hypothetical protein
VVYGSFSDRGQIDANGKQVVAASVARYIARISGTGADVGWPILLKNSSVATQVVR